jgi:hypothetical protein
MQLMKKWQATIIFLRNRLYPAKHVKQVQGSHELLMLTTALDYKFASRFERTQRSHDRRFTPQTRHQSDTGTWPSTHTHGNRETSVPAGHGQWN